MEYKMLYFCVVFLFYLLVVFFGGCKIIAGNIFYYENVLLVFLL